MNDLIQAAIQVRDHAYCPYSNYRVGCAVRGENGSVYVGCNVENISFGATICAERSAICAMIAAGCHVAVEVAVSTLDGATPCGMCLQVLAEFCAADTPIHLVADDASVQTLEFTDFLPLAFKSSEVLGND